MGRRFLTAAFLAGACACAGSTANGPPPAERTSAADLHARKCGRCHLPPKPKTRPRSDLERAAFRHRNRVKLTEAEWNAVIDYLAIPSDSAP
jgi:hypothetical protein